MDKIKIANIMNGVDGVEMIDTVKIEKPAQEESINLHTTTHPIRVKTTGADSLFALRPTNPSPFGFDLKTVSG